MTDSSVIDKLVDYLSSKIYYKGNVYKAKVIRKNERKKIGYFP